jgi:hypothetical protein
MPWPIALFVSLWGGKTVVRSPECIVCRTWLQLVGLQPHASAMMLHMLNLLHKYHIIRFNLNMSIYF